VPHQVHLIHVLIYHHQLLGFLLAYGNPTLLPPILNHLYLFLLRPVEGDDLLLLTFPVADEDDDEEDQGEELGHDLDLELLGEVQELGVLEVDETPFPHLDPLLHCGVSPTGRSIPDLSG